MRWTGTCSKDIFTSTAEEQFAKNIVKKKKMKNNTGYMSSANANAQKDFRSSTVPALFSHFILLYFFGIAGRSDIIVSCSRRTTHTHTPYRKCGKERERVWCSKFICTTGVKELVKQKEKKSEHENKSKTRRLEIKEGDVSSGSGVPAVKLGGLWH